jgi:ERCC4-type nuclease
VSHVHVTIVVDVGELRSGVPDVLRASGAKVRVETLAVADYLVRDSIGVERKTVRDFHRSIANGRLWTQLLGCRKVLDRTYLIVEGLDLDRGCLTSGGIRGAVLEIGDRGVTVLRSTDPADTARWLMRISIRLNRRAAAVRRVRRYPRRATPLSLLSVVPGIGPQTAANLIDHFGSIRAIAGAAPSDLEQVDGVGPQRAAVLARILSERL